MRNLILVLASAFIGSSVTALLLSEPHVTADGAQGGGAEICAQLNGDVNADGGVDLSDAVTILGNLFLGNPTELVPLCGSAPSAITLPATGQTQCFDCEGNSVPCRSCLGQPRPCEGFVEPSLALQDSMQRTGCPNDTSRFTIALHPNAEDTVIDNCTGLEWQRFPSPLSPTWCQALDMCNGLSYGEHDDWRLPNVRELQSLVDYGRHSPSIDPVFATLPVAYWSSTSSVNSPTLAWGVIFLDGSLAAGFKSGGHLVRAVRNAQ